MTKSSLCDKKMCSVFQVLDKSEHVEINLAGDVFIGKKMMSVSEVQSKDCSHILIEQLLGSEKKERIIYTQANSQTRSAVLCRTLCQYQHL